MATRLLQLYVTTTGLFAFYSSSIFVVQIGYLKYALTSMTEHSEVLAKFGRFAVVLRARF